MFGYLRLGRLGVLALVIVALALTASGCGASPTPTPAGPDVRGMALAEAETTLKNAGIAYSEHALDGLFGIVVKQNWVVCDEHSVNERMVRLDAAKHGCDS
jgi:hypothetical protein